jgi:hypothetical protein
MPISETQTVGAPCIETKSTEPSKHSMGTNLTVWTEASEISVYRLSHAADFSPPHHDSTPTPRASATRNPPMPVGNRPGRRLTLCGYQRGDCLARHRRTDGHQALGHCRWGTPRARGRRAGGPRLPRETRSSDRRAPSSSRTVHCRTRSCASCKKRTAPAKA